MEMRSWVVIFTHELPLSETWVEAKKKKVLSRRKKLEKPEVCTNPNHDIMKEPIEVTKNLVYEKRHVQILIVELNSFVIRVSFRSKSYALTIPHLKLHGIRKMIWEISFHTCLR